ncbi:MAG: alcohol dehydrogenase catalytic domain-containing protein, partial [Burkholderiaceae bacterium]|nr:alcohol dehydrogenase catalytic domain-containing protein [Burkholderiaceae bacterium]
MKAIEIIQSGEAGDTGQLRVMDAPVPVPRQGEVLIKVHAAGVNRPDVLQRRGRYYPPAGASAIPGLEVAGVIAGGDLEGSGFAMGDRVCALLQG